MHSDLRTLLESKLAFLDVDVPSAQQRGAQVAAKVLQSDEMELRYMLDQASDMLVGLAQAAGFLSNQAPIRFLDDLAELAQGEVPRQSP